MELQSLVNSIVLDKDDNNNKNEVMLVNLNFLILEDKVFLFDIVQVDLLDVDI